MASNPLQSAGRRFLAKFGVAFAWASLVSVVLGGATYFRVPRVELDEQRPWHVDVRLWLERLELLTFDWRARMLGDQSTRSDAVVLLSLDDETLANARLAVDPSLAVRPWPRDLLGRLGSQALREGARQVVFALALADLSPRGCATAEDESDDEAMRRRLEADPGKSLLQYQVLDEVPRPAERELTPWVLKIGDYSSEAESRAQVRRVLARRVPAYRVPTGRGGELWTAATSEADARALAAALELKGPLVIRPETPDDTRFEVTPGGLLAELAELDFKGDSSALPLARALEGPVAPLLSGVVRYGAANLAHDVDWGVRAVPLAWRSVDAEGRTHVVASVALQAALRQLGSTQVSWVGHRLTLSDTVSVPVDESCALLLRWDASDVGRGARGSLKRSIPLWRLAVNLGDDEAKRGLRHHDNELSDRVVLIADTTSVSVPTPIGRLEQAAVTGQAVVNLLAGQGIARAEPLFDFWLTVGLAFTGAVLAVTFSSLFRRAGWLAMLLTMGASCGLYAFVARYLFLTQTRWVAMAAPMLALSLTFLASLGYAATIERSLRDFMFRALGRAIRPEVFRRVESDLDLMRPERREVAVYFSDLEGFTAISHRVEPVVLIRMLQDYLARMTQAIVESHGQVDKYLGDGVMAFFGAPVHLENPAAAACEAALAMGAAFERQRPGWEKRVGQPLVFRAGLDFGEALVGEMGTEHRRTYSVIGEPVAAAARLEQLARRYHAHVVVTGAVVEHASARYVFRELDTVRLKRRPNPVRLFELVGLSGSLPSAQLEGLGRFAGALGAYGARRFKEARAAFEALSEHDRLAGRYVTRCQYYEATPPPAEWDGVFSGPEAD